MYRQILVTLILFFAFAAARVEGQVPASKHVAFVPLENEDYSTIVGNPSMPYLNGLIAKYGLATQYYADTHPSIGNYMMLATGQIITNDNKYTGTVTADNLVREFLLSGKTWKVYAESLPYDGYLGVDCCDYYPYDRIFNPFSYLSDVRNSSNQTLNIVQFSEFSTDLANGRLPNYSWIVPDQQSNGHDCPPGMSTCTTAQKLAYVDNWLQTHIDPLVSDATFQTDGILGIVYDEALTDNTNGGGRVVFTVIGPLVKSGYQSTTFYQHESALKLACDALGITCPGAGATAPGMGEFFSASASTPRCSLTVSPTSGVAPLSVNATGSCTDSGDDISTTTLDWGDGTTQTATSGPHTYNNAGTYTARLTATDTQNLTGSASQTVTVTTPAAAADFSLSVSPNSRTVTRGGSTTYTVKVSPSKGFTGTVTLSVAGVGSGTTTVFTPTTVTQSGSSTLSVSPSTTAATGTFTLTISGTSGSLVHTSKVSLKVR